LDLLGALDFPTKGEICAFGIDLGTLSNEQRNRLRRQKIGLVFQELRLISHLTAVENVMLPRLFDGIPRGTLEEASKKLLSSVKMSARADHFPFELSYGEQQRVAIARAISTSPAILLADEPTANLDDDNAGQVVGIFRGLQAAGTTIVVATHDNRLAGGADRIIKLETGGVIE
jgi:putative ABC transport system ATP-binding protein